MNPTDDVVSKQLEQIRLENELAEHHANPNTYSARNLPVTWESKNKYGEDFLTIREEDREEIEGALGVIDQSELLLCELPDSHAVNNAGDSLRSGNRPRETDGDSERLGSEIYQYDQELRRLARFAQGKRNYDESLARKSFPEFELWKALDNSRLSTKRREELFHDPWQSFGRQDGRFSMIGELKGIAPTTAYDYYKCRPAGLKRRERRSK